MILPTRRDNPEDCELCGEAKIGFGSGGGICVRCGSKLCDDCMTKHRKDGSCEAACAPPQVNTESGYW